MKHEDAQTGEETTVKLNAQIGEETRNSGFERLERKGESERRPVAPGRFRVVSAPEAFSVGVGGASDGSKKPIKTADWKETAGAGDLANSADLTEAAVSEESADLSDSGDFADALKASDGEFDDENAFFASFSADTEARRAADSFDDAFAGGLRSLFDAEAEESENVEAAEEDESDGERFQRDFERERRESLDGVLLQNDADFLREAGEKYERSRVSDADFERKSGARSDLGRASNGRNNADCQNGENKENGETGGGVEASGGRRAPIGPASILEAMLFVGDRENRPLTLARATELMRNVSETEAIEALADLNERYWRDGAPYRIVRDGDGFRMALRPEFDALAARFVGGKTKEFKLTQTMIDVLALIAYRQPISLDEILETRNNATGALSQLVKRELVAQEKRVVDKKKIAFYSTTPRFLRLFNLESLDDLPIVGDVDYR